MNGVLVMRDLLSHFYMVIFGLIASTSRYLHDLGLTDNAFSFFKWVSQAFVGCTVAVLAKLICERAGASEETTYILGMVFAISGREIMTVIPKLTQKYIVKKSEEL